MRDVAGLQQIIRERSPFPPERTEELIASYFQRVPLRTQYAIERLHLDKARVLDVGCAFGTSLFQFGPGSVGIDNNPDAVTFCDAVGLEVDLVDVDAASDFDRPDGFDFVWVSDILEHLEAPRLVLRRLAPALRPGGALLLQLSVLPTSHVARRLLRRTGKQPFDADVHYHQWMRDTVRHLLERAGYSVAAVEVPRPPSWRYLDPFLHPGIAPRLLFVATA